MVVFAVAQVGTMMEVMYGEVVRTNFEDIECKPDPIYPSGIACSSAKDDDSSDDDDIKEFYVDPAPSARARVQDVGRVESGLDPTPPATSRVQDNRCTADNLCSMEPTPLTTRCHVCLNFRNKVHGCLRVSFWPE